MLHCVVVDRRAPHDLKGRQLDEIVWQIPSEPHAVQSPARDAPVFEAKIQPFQLPNSAAKAFKSVTRLPVCVAPV